MKYKKGTKEYSEEFKNRICESYKLRMGLEEISREYKLGVPEIITIFIAKGIKRRIPTKEEYDAKRLLLNLDLTVMNEREIYRLEVELGSQREERKRLEEELKKLRS